MSISAALPTFVITLREGVEAALVVGIVLAYLQKAQRTQLNSWVYGGIAAGIAASVGVGAIFNGILSQVQAAEQDTAAVLEPLIESVFGGVAIALLSWMLIWMTQQAKGLKAEVEGAVNTAIQSDGAGWAVFSLIGIAVLREGFETVVFIAAQFQAGGASVMGAIAGLGGAVLIGFLLFRLGIRINLRRFFQVMGVFLLLIVSGLVVGVLHHLDETAIAIAQIQPAWMPFCAPEAAACLLGPQLWDTSAVLPDAQAPGVLLKALIGYRDHLYLVQAIGYLLFLSTVGGLYFRSLSIAVQPAAIAERPASEPASGMLD